MRRTSSMRFLQNLAVEHLDATLDSSPSPTTKEWERAGEREDLSRKNDVGAGKKRLLSPALSSIPWRRGSPMVARPEAVSKCALFVMVLAVVVCLVPSRGFSADQPLRISASNGVQPI